MKKILAIIMAVMMLAALTQSALALEISPSAEIQLVDIVFIDILPSGEERRTDVPEDSFESYYVLVKTADAEEGSNLKRINGQLKTDEDVAAVFGDNFTDNRLVKNFAITHIGEVPAHDYVEFSIYIAEMKDSDQNTLMCLVNGVWEEIQIASIKDSIVTFKVLVNKAEAVYSVLAKKYAVSPETGIDTTPVFLIAAAVLFLGTSAFAVRRAAKKKD